jgi:hypothetical protein
VHYEDIAYLATQIHECLNYEHDNPALKPLVRDLCRDLTIREPELKEASDSLVKSSKQYVSNVLNGLTPKSDHLKCILDAAKSGSQTCIVSLNHDCLIEKAFQASGVELDDQLRTLEDGRRVLRPSVGDGKVALYKILGSVDWFSWMSRNSDASGTRQRVGREPTGTADMDWERADDEPAILVGRFNKELEYVGATFAKLICCARHALSETNLLVVSGYSFGDKAVNSMIIDWMTDETVSAQRLIVAHKNHNDLWNGSRGAIQNKTDAWRRGGRLREPTHYLGAMTWDQLQQYFS